MVVHQHVCVQVNVIGKQRLAELLQVACAVLVAEESDQPVFLTLHNVLRVYGQIHKEFAGHRFDKPPSAMTRIGLTAPP